MDAPLALASLGSAARRSLVLALATALPLASCRSEAADGFSSELARLELGPEQIRIGSVDDPEHAYASVRNLSVDAAGRIYTTHFQETQVRVWSPDGTAAGVIGREGDGPGEFRGITRMGLFGDSLWVVDSNANRFSFFTTDGTFVGSLTPPRDLGDRDSPYPLPARPELPLRDGTFYGSSPAFSQAIAEGDLTWTPHVRLDADGAVTDTLYKQEWRPEHQLALLRPGGQGGTFGQQPFPDGAITSPDAAHGRLLVVERAAWTGSGPASWAVTAISMRGDTLWRHEQAYRPVPLPAERLDSVAEAQAESMHVFMSRFEPGLSQAALRERIDAALYRPGWVPPVTSLVAGRDGSVWIGLASGPEDGPNMTWLVLDERGRPTARVRTPADLRVLEADREHVWGVRTDEFDVNYIVRHALVGSQATAAEN